MQPPMVELIFTGAKYCLYLTLVRLATSAFNWEFGVSRQYLRLLEWMFELGQDRIRRVESQHSLHSGSCLGRCQANDDENENENENEGLACQTAGSIEARRRQINWTKDQNSNCGDSAETRPHRPNRLDLLGRVQCNGTANGNESEPIELRARAKPQRALNWSSEGPGVVARPSATAESKQRMRRVSTPDGPPVFLLDDFGDDSAEGACSELLEQHEFHMEDAARFVVRGVAAIIDDQVTKRFTPEHLKSWNLLTRTNAKNYQFMSRSLGLFWLSGLLFRYCILLPLRIMFTLTGFLWLVCTMTILGLLPEQLRAKPYAFITLMAFRMLSCGITSRLSFHNRQFRAKRGDICVANHTSPIDVVLLACDNCYALVGQRHGGLLGLLEDALSRATRHVWFDRAQMRDRQLVTERLRAHVSNKSNLPVLIFPEGTCINNSAVMMFRKGSFETTNRVCPVAIKYDPRFGDPFWNSSKQSYVQYLLMMMSSWAIKCDVWYLPPMERLTDESSAEFANRVKAEIARQGGLVDLAWDGQLKRSSVKPAWLYQQQEDYVKRLKLE